MDDRNAVLGHSHVHLERRHPDGHRSAKPGERILWQEPASAAMSLKVETRRQGGGAGAIGVTARHQEAAQQSGKNDPQAPASPDHDTSPHDAPASRPG